MLPAYREEKMAKNLEEQVVEDMLTKSLSKAKLKFPEATAAEN